MPESHLLNRQEVKLVHLLRSDPVFAGRLLIEGPAGDYAPHQRYFFRDSWRRSFVLTNRGRGATKTFDLSRIAILDAMLYSRWKVVITSASFRQAKYVFQEIERAVQNSAFLQDATAYKGGPSMLPDQCVWKLKNGSTVQALPLGDGGKIRGARANTLLIDETAQVPEEVIDLVIRPMLATAADPMTKVRLMKLQQYEAQIRAAGIDFDRMMRHNRLIMASSAWYQFNHWYRKYKLYLKKTQQFLPDGRPNPEYDPDYGLYVFDYRDLPEGFMDMSQIEDARANMTIMDFLMEWCGYFPLDSDGYFTASLIEACSNPMLQIRLFPHPGRRYVMGVDPARTNDFFAVSLFEEVEPGLWALVYMYADRKISFPQMASIVGGLMARFNVCHICMDQGGGGLALMDALLEPEPKIKKGLVPPVNQEVEYGPIKLFDDEAKSADPQGILDMVHFSTDVTRELFTGMKSSLEGRSVQFAAQEYIHGQGPLAMAAEEVIQHMMLTKTELRAIQVTANPQGTTLHWDTVGNQPKDRAVAAVLGLYAAKRATALSRAGSSQDILGGIVSSGVFGKTKMPHR